jgi:deoxycytidylate deaminase
MAQKQRTDWDMVWMAHARMLARRSLCHNGAGAVIAAADNHIGFPGYAGPPRSQPTIGLTNCRSFCQRHNKPVKDRDPGYGDCQSIHAEQNALVTADRTLIRRDVLHQPRSVLDLREDDP